MRKGKKKIGLFVLSLALLGNAITPMKVSAAEEGASTTFGKEKVEDAVVYEEYTVSEFKECYGVKAPTPKTIEGYYFGGWYEDKPGAGETDADCNAIMELSQGENDSDGKIYAKFVPNYMLNVKVQNSFSLKPVKNDAGEVIWAESETGKTDIRMISAIDSSKYKEVGFHVFVGGNRLTARKTTKYNRTVYEQVSVSKDGKTALAYYTAEQLFGLSSGNYDPKLITAKFANIPEKGWKTSIFVRPYWITYDGIEVRGNGRYIHVEDGIKGYITVPVNLHNLTNTKGVVAGTLDVKYDSTKLTYIDTISRFTDDPDKPDDSYKVGTDMSTMAVKQSSVDVGEGLKKIKCAAIRKIDGTMYDIVPNRFAAQIRAVEDTFSDEYKDAEMNDYEVVNNMYVALRFKPTAEYEGVGDFLHFEISNTNFCDTLETPVSVDVWDVRY